ncbi:MAG: hypothetical protein ABI165_12085 [Bryobacteraceae bacterium]
MIRAIFKWLFISILSAFPMNAAEAKIFYLPSPRGNEIVLNRDHISVSLLHGWVSSKDSYFRALLSHKSKLAIGIDETVQYFDGGRSGYSKLLENSDIQRDTGRPWGAVLTLIDSQPGDADPSLTFRLAIYRDDRLSQILDAAKGAEPPDVTGQVDLWTGYGRLLSAVVSNIFGTNSTNYPFLLSVDIKAGGLAGGGRMREHYLVGIAPNQDDDKLLPALDARKLQYDEASQRLTYDGETLLDHSYVVLKVSKGDPVDITQMIAESEAPWAVLAVTQFLSIPTADAQNKDQLVMLSRSPLTQLKTELDLLKTEHRFSAYDRAVALNAFAAESRGAIAAACAAHQVPAAACPTADLDQFIAQIQRIFGLPAGVTLSHSPSPPVDFKALRRHFH